MSCCRGKGHQPSKVKMASTLVLSVANAIANAVKTGKLIAPESKVHKRIEICKGCRHLDETRCTICGCYVNVKAGLDSERCPLNLW